ncbi:MAG: putative metal-binding motif-containing protein [Myxococcales bacterium]|nr:putative metal-binding motif-containing protein [Myxococcales bacterium]MCB9672954.1 putative metal-binding motif-containing protein [Alphaproteobacteria bacterium]
MPRVRLSRIPLLLLALGCKGTPTPTEPPVCTVGWADRDGDGYGSPLLQTSSCQEPIVENDLDCDDTALAIHPDAVEVCDGVDNDCNGLVDLDDPSIGGADQWEDVDGDGFGAGEPVRLCEAITGWVTNGDDCDDILLEVNPDAVEVCDGVDNDCNELADDEDPGLDTTTADTWFVDDDGDTFGTNVEILACVQPEGTATNPVDCDDMEPTTHPGAVEICNNLDSDCDGGPDGTTVSPDVCAEFEMAYTGAYTATIVQGGETRTCSGTATIQIDRALDPALQGSFTCSLDAPAGGFTLGQAGTITGWVTRDGDAWGTVEAFAGTVRDWEGSVAAGSQTGSGDGLQIDGGTAWNLDFSWTVSPSAP